MNKYNYYFVIQANSGDGWEDMCFVDRNAANSINEKRVTSRFYAQYLLREHKLSWSVPHRIVSRRALA